MAQRNRKPDAVPVPPSIPMPPLGPRETVVWEEADSRHALRAALPCLFVLHHPAHKPRPLYIGHAGAAAGEARPSNALLGPILGALRLVGVRCHVAHLTPLQFENCRRIERFLVRSWRPRLNRAPAPNARMIAVITYEPWGGGESPD